MASELYDAQVRLLMRVLPFLGRQTGLALKGGTAINLFVQDLPLRGHRSRLHRPRGPR